LFLEHFLRYRKPHIRPAFSAILTGLLFFFFLSLSAPVFSQNTKGDRPGANRESRFRTGSKKKKSQGSAKRIRSRNKSTANSGGRTRSRSSTGRKERVGKPIKPVYSVKPSSEKQKAWRGDITGRRVRTKNKSSVKPYVHPQNGGGLVRKRVIETEGRRNVYPQGGKYVGGYSKKAPDRKPVYAKSKVSGDTRVPPPSDKRRSGGGARGRVTPRSATRSYISNKSINIYARFARSKARTGGVTTKDIAGRKLRTRNYQTRGPGLIKAIVHPSQQRKRAGDREYSGKSYSGSFSTSRSGRAWRGDLAHNKLRYRNHSSKRGTEGSPTITGGLRSRTPGGTTNGGRRVRSASRSGESRPGTSPVPVKTPGLGGQIAGYSGRMKQGRTPMRDQGEAFSGFKKNRKQLTRDQGEGFTGFKKNHRPVKGGGSRSGKKWNNGGAPIQVRTPGNGVDVGTFQGNVKRGRRGMADQGEGFTGFKKSSRPVKGGGSVSGRTWNNRQSPLPRRITGGDISSIPINLRRKRTNQVDQGEEFSGFKKASKPVKGGGSVSGKLWNNRQSPIYVGTPPESARRAMEFSGYAKASRPVKGGGSISGKLWNNKETPIAVRRAPETAIRALEYSGNTKVNLMRYRFRDQGEEFTGFIKRSKRSYVQNEHAVEESLKKKRPGKSVFDADGLQVKVERRDYVRNKNAAEDALMKLKPTKVDQQVGGLQVKVSRRDYVRNKNSAEDALMKLKPTKTTKAVGELQVRVKQYHYVRNPASAREALKVREPGKAFARATDYQGNIRMKKFSLFDKNRAQHPDTRFIKTNKNNVDGERDVLTNLKLWWARLFKKQEAQPENLKEKGRKPRYDSGEKGMWYD
jgi:hypothetical protein